MDKSELVLSIAQQMLFPNIRKTPVSTSPQSANTTLIACTNADWNHMSPFFVFKGKSMNEELMTGATAGAMATMSDGQMQTC
ncbi:hypothetical protein DPMN_089696 [Dreissena polymorpha]|uniref:Uncharacterized protein n=1 Tax=Dreissena polymorpha TaxID=45954 RepID=A0A9D4KWX3_DREPO|nr:hypothetical protein DPMN_089696 [Dreissena polymorpha]